ncbi:MAG: hydroxymethylpyrimidine/phosphomethylpyrimidine kinase [Pseudomonadota bacterium]
MNQNKPPPIVMCFSGNDPSGGAGIQADIETLASLDCHCSPVVTALTVQDSSNISELHAVPPDIIVKQAQLILEDMSVDLFKIGLLGNTETIAAVATIIREYPEIPVVFDPILAAGGGTSLMDDDIVDMVIDEILPETTICTPNSFEARILGNEKSDLEACAHQILDLGCAHALITGSHESTPLVHNTLYSLDAEPVSTTWERLPAMYHGSGCTLASAIAGIMAHGIPVTDAVQEAQEFTWNSLAYGASLGRGQLIPNRFFWSRNEDVHEA